MKAAIQGTIALETRAKTSQTSLEAVHAGRRAPVNLIDAALLAERKMAKALASLAFSTGT